VLRGTILTIHLLCVVVWLGAGLYELFLAHEMKRARGTAGEAVLLRIYVRYGPTVAIATLLIAASGAVQSSLFGWGYFQTLWLGAKQALMLFVLATMAFLSPTFLRLGRLTASLPRDAGEVPEEARVLLRRSEPFILAMRGAGLVALALAVFRPGGV
jgi:uncharacterized membrane protein